MQRKYSRKYRYCAIALCLALCLESSPVQVLAVEDTVGMQVDIATAGDSAGSSGARNEENTGETADQTTDQDHAGQNGPGSDNAGNAGSNQDAPGGSDDGTGDYGSDHTDTGSTDSENGDADSSDSDGNGSDNSDSDSSGSDNSNSDSNGSDNNDSENDGSDNNGSGDTDSGIVPDVPDDVNPPADTPDSDSGSISDNDLSSVSENDLSSVSENDLSSVSENSLEEDRQAMIKAAGEAFTKLLAQKDLMALLYHTDTYSARLWPYENSETTATLEIGQTLYIKGVTITDSDVWYAVQFYIDGAEGTGYVQSYYLAYSDEDWIAWENEYLLPILEIGDTYGITAFGMAAGSMMPYAMNTSDITAFPGSYQSALRDLKNAHPNWTFVPMKTGLDFAASVSKEMGDKSLIQKTTSNASKGWVGNACPSESGWYYATRPAVEYYMDPRNFLTETYIFQFEQLTFNASYHTQSAVQTFLNTTFMKGVLPDDTAKRTYAQAFFEIGKNRRLSPIHLASRVYQEQGKGTSGLISGTYPGYENYYNFFNVGVNGSSTTEKIVKGLTYAKSKGWNTRYKSLEGGAATIGNNYILKYQDTLYLEKFNVDRNSPYGLYNHQYMQNIQAPASESSTTKKMYANAGSLNSAFVFKIPVYNNMPNESGIAPPVPEEPEKIPVLKLSKTALKLDRSSARDCTTGQTLKLYADGKVVNLPDEEVIWSSSDTSVVTVEDGTVRAVEGGKTGEAVITVSYKKAEISCKVTVQATLQSISLDQNEVSLRRPDTVVEDITGLSEEERRENTATVSLQVTFDPADTTANRTIVWTSSNTRVAKVAADPTAPADAPRAVVTAVGKGEAVITAKASKAGGTPVKSASCKVKVSAPIYQVELSNPNVAEADQVETTTLLAGQSVNLAAEYWPKDTTSDTQVAWSSSDERVATVRNGKVVAIAGGTAVITARVAGCEQGYAAQHTIMVEECHVTFMGKDSSTVLKKQTVRYGDALSVQEFPTEEELESGTADDIFIGWYTGIGGTGSRFDENTLIHRQETVLYPHYEEQGKGFYILPVGDQTYTGNVIKPEVRVFDSITYEDGSRERIELVLNKDYTISYKNNKKVNLEGKAAPTITVKGKGNYAGTESISFNIVPKPLTDTDVTADDITVAYTGRTIKSAPTVWRSGKKLARNTDYTVTYPQTGTGAYQTAGTYPILITGKGGYTGTITVYETITQKVLLGKVAIAKIPNQTYRNDLVDKEQGIGIMPELKVTYKKEALTESTDGGLTGDYTVSYKNNTAVGTATATITAVEGSGFAGSKSITYKIVGTAIGRAKVEGLENREYTGSEEDARQAPGAYTLTLNGNVLTESQDDGVTGDYVVSYTNVSKVGTATILFKGINEYTGQIRKSYKITGYQIGPDESGSNPAITMQYYTQDEPDSLKEIADLSQVTTPYMKGGSKPVVLLTFNGIHLEPGKDYTIRYANNNTVATKAMQEELPEKKRPKITVTGKGNFRGSITGYFEITDGQMSPDNGKLTMTVRDVVYKKRKNAYKSVPVLTDCNGARLAAGRDYEKNLLYTYAEDTEWTDTDGNVISRNAGDFVAADDIPEAGTVIRVTAQGKGFYAGAGAAEISADYRIVAADIAKARVTVQTKEYRNGQPVTLTENDLKITVSGNTEPLQYGIDYTIDENTYTKNVNKGKATVTLRGLGNYGGEKKITYTIATKKLAWWKNLF